MLKITIITPSLNNEKLLPGFYETIKSQDYPMDNIELLLLDGGSTDKTIEIGQKYGAKVVNNPDKLAEPAVNLGMNIATGDIMMILAVDNYLGHNDYLTKMTKAFENPEVYAAFPKQDSDESDTIYTRYVNTFTDPFNHFVYDKAANSRTFNKIYNVLESNEIYDVYDYESNDTLPMIAFAQGFTIRKGYQRDKGDSFDDCLPVLKLIQDKKKIAYIHSCSCIHHTIFNLKHFIKKQRWATQNALNKVNYGVSFRQNLLSEGQKFRSKIWPIYALSFLFPLLRSLWKVVIKREEIIWLFHAPMCMFSAFASVSEVISVTVFKKGIVSRQ